MELAPTKDPSRQPGFLIKAYDVEFLWPPEVAEAANALPAQADAADQPAA